ncbi:MAG: FHA domain-containing protein [Bacteroidia bacterium]|jgi:pSer/pThr/pTyr-binding forkhead associated (FHA) protein|nr:FHA domain-containing protein [Bacteroidia bacterium]GIV23323.1 MAG: hypothetical protein KatS3mg025_0982 [Bacteroidia bacterium]
MAHSPSLKRTFLLGRSSECDIVLSHPEVSGRHALLTIHPDGRVEIQDVGSKNGVYVNGEKVLTKFLQPGDTLFFGSYRVDWEEILRKPPPPGGGSESPTRMTRVPIQGKNVWMTLGWVVVAIVVAGAILYFFVRPWVFQDK